MVSFKSHTLLMFAMFASMWLFAIAQSPGGLTAFGNEISSAEQGLVSAATYAPTPQPGTNADGTQGQTVETYAGGVICLETPTDSGHPSVNCEAPAAFFPY